MNARKIIIGLVILVLLLAFTIPAAGEPKDSIVVNGADAIRQESVSVSQDLMDSAANVGPRIALQYANLVRHIELVTMPSALQAKLEEVSDRIVVEYANTIRHIGLAVMPSELGSLLVPMPDRIVLQYANNNCEMSLAYPIELFNDSTLPQISEVAASRDDGIITWVTDEFATSTVLYGVETGVYTSTVIDPLYVKQHEVTLPGLTAGATYYYEVSSTDQSGNMATSSEYSFTVQSQVLVYLPLVVRNH